MRKRKKRKLKQRKMGRLSFKKQLIEYSSPTSLINLYNEVNKKDEKMIKRTLNVPTKKTFENYSITIRDKYGSYKNFKKVLISTDPEKKWKFTIIKYNIYESKTESLQTVIGEIELGELFVNDPNSIIPNSISTLSKTSIKFIKNIIRSLTLNNMKSLFVEYEHLHEINFTLKHKDNYTNWIFEALFGLTSIQKKRDLELEYIKTNNVNNFFFSLCKFTLPQEIISIILSYMKNDLELLDNVGCLNTDWYLILLKNWNIIKIKETTLESIPILVLRNVEKIIVYSTRHNWLISKQNYLLNNVFNLSTLILDGFGKKNILEMFSRNVSVCSKITKISIFFQYRRYFDRTKPKFNYYSVLPKFKNLCYLGFGVIDGMDHWKFKSDDSLRIRENLLKCKKLKKIKLYIIQINCFGFGLDGFDFGRYNNDCFDYLPNTIESIKFKIIGDYFDIDDRLYKFKLKTLGFNKRIRCYCRLKFENLLNLEKLTVHLENIRINLDYKLVSQPFQMSQLNNISRLVKLKEFNCFCLSKTGIVSIHNNIVIEHYFKVELKNILLLLKKRPNLKLNFHIRPKFRNLEMLELGILISNELEGFKNFKIYKCKKLEF